MIDADNDSDNDSDDNIGDINDDNNGDINDAEDDDNNSDINNFYPLLAKAVIPQAGFLHKIFSLELFFFPPDDNPDDDHNDNPDDNHNNNSGDNNNDHPDEGDGDDGELSHCDSLTPNPLKTHNVDCCPCPSLFTTNRN